MIRPTDELVYDRASSDVVNKTSKGYYNISDLNRVEGWCGYLAKLFTLYGYPVHITTKTNWSVTDFPYSSEMERIRSNVEKVKQVYCSYLATPLVPTTLNRIDIEKANAIEKILFNIDELMNKMVAEFRKSGTFNCGGMEGLI